MRLPEIERQARTLGIKDTRRYARKELIKEIQRLEGNSQCFVTDRRYHCDQLACCWRSDCVR